MKPFSIRIFVPSGNPEGVRIVSRDDWPGKAIVFPRELLGEVKGRLEYKQPGVYLLAGGRLNKAHVQHLESRLVALAREAGLADLDNGNQPLTPALSEEVDAEIQEETEQKTASRQGGKRADIYSALPRGMRFTFHSSTGMRATLELLEGGVIVKAGSEAVLETKQHFEIHGASYAAKRRELIESGILMPGNKNYQFSEDQFFSSASAAASVIAGQNHNADHWVADDGTNLGDMLRARRAK